MKIIASMTFRDVSKKIPPLMPVPTTGFFSISAREPPVSVYSRPDKWALAGSLTVRDPQFLADLKLFAARFGTSESVHYVSDDPGITAAVASDVDAARKSQCGK